MSSPCRLYLISPPCLEATAFTAVLADALADGGVAAFQLRLKEASDGEILAACAALAPIARAADCAFILNDRPDLAARAGADGVHIGQSDAPLKEARKILGPAGIIGVTCHNSRHLAMEAGEAGADYVAFGAFYPSLTKAAETRATPDLLSWWQDIMEIPCVAIGGIGLGEARALREAGADFLAVSSGVWAHPLGPRAAVKAYNVEIS